MLTIKPLTIPDIPAARRLSDQANWNHLDADWHRLITLWPDTCLAGWLEDKIIATVTLATFGPADAHLAWVGVMLVDQAQRGAGHGGAMFDAILRLGEERDISNFGLDATDMGKPLYAKRRFDDRVLMHRWKCPAPKALAARTFPAPIRMLAAKDWPGILKLDKAATSINRAALLQHLAGEKGVFTLVAEESGIITGFGMLRPGREASYIGPIIAPYSGTATVLFGALVSAHKDPATPLFIDTAANPPLQPALAAHGFTIARTLTRMGRAADGHPLAYGPQVFAIAGLELS